MLNGVTQLNMMKADVLDDFEEIKVCTHYKLPNGEVTDKVPHQLIDEELTPVYETLPGWQTSSKEVQTYAELPAAFHNYLQFLEKELNVPITIVSVGPDRVSTLMK
jgi:adenylosuccinate synthase